MSKKHSRKKLSDTIRFEVFKRDKFTCHYCGTSAPDVVLHIDHIHPVSKGGSNDLTNLITSCKSCNQGKSNKLLSDDSIVRKKRKQMEYHQERINQIEMMQQWNKDLYEIEEKELQLFLNIFTQITKYSINESAYADIKKTIKTYGLQNTIEALRTTCERYLVHNNDKDVYHDSVEKVLNKLSRICYFLYDEKGKEKRKVNYTAGILKNRFPEQFYDLNSAKEYIIETHTEKLIPVDDIKYAASESSNYDDFIDHIWFLESIYKKNINSHD